MNGVTRTLVIGVGNEFRRDDAVGLHVARRLADLSVPHVLVAECAGDGTSLMDLWQGYRRVILVDAVSSGAPAGTVSRWTPGPSMRGVSAVSSSSHAFGVEEAVAMSRALECLPSTIIIYGIEGKDFSFGIDLSPEVASAADDLTHTIVRSLASE